MRKLLAPIVAVLMIGGIVSPGVAALSAQAQTDTPVVAAMSNDLVVDASYRVSERTSRNTVRTTETNLVPSKAVLVDFERDNAIVAVPKPKPKVVKKTTKVLTVAKPKVVKKSVVKKKVSTFVPPQNGNLAGIEKVAARYYGVPYVWGGNTPSGFDCSGFTKYVYRQFGITLPRVSRDQYAFTRHISRSQARPGDLVFYGSPVHHVGIYVGNGYMIDAPRRGSVVSKRKVYTSETPKFGRIP